MLLLPFLAGTATGGVGGLAVALGKAALIVVGVILAARLAGRCVAQIGEFSFWLAREGQGAGLLPGWTYQTFLAVAVSTMLLTPFLIQGGPAIVAGLQRVLPRRLMRETRAPQPEATQEPLRDHVIIAGFGLNGRNLSAALRSVGVAYLVNVLNAESVYRARALGDPLFYGDATRVVLVPVLGS